MRLYYAQFPFEVDAETGNSTLYFPTLLSLTKEVTEIVQHHVENDATNLHYHCTLLGEPIDGMVAIEIRVKVERIAAVKLTPGLFCSAVNNAGNAGFVSGREEIRPMIFRFKVPAELFEREETT